jgi:hypothetical protein
MFRTLLVLSWCGILSASALAQAPPPPAPEALRAHAQELISAANAEGIFAPEANERVSVLRHVSSGMRCLFPLGASGRAAIIPSESLGIPRGDDVACTQNVGLGTVTLYATRYPRTQTLESAMQGAVAAMLVRYPDAREATLTDVERFAAPEGRTIPESRTAAFMVRDGDHQLFTRISVYVAGGWEYKMRFTSEIPRANVMADMVWMATLSDLASINAQPPH